MSKKRAHQSGYYKGTNSLGHTAWRKIHEGTKAIDTELGKYGFGGAENFLDSLPFHDDIGNLSEEDRKRLNAEGRSVMSQFDEIQEELAGNYSSYSAKNIMDAPPKERARILQEYNSEKSEMENHLENIEQEYEEKYAELKSEILKIHGDSGSDESTEVKRVNREIEKKLDNIKTQRDKQRNMVFLEYSDVSAITDEYKKDYLKASVAYHLADPNNLYAITHDKDTFNEIYDMMLDKNNNDENSAIMREELNKVFHKNYGITFTANDNGVFVPRLHNTGQSYGEILSAAKKCEILQEWSGTAGHGFYMGENFVNSSSLMKSVIKKQRMRTLMVMGQLMLARFARHQVNKAIYGKNYRPYRRYDHELQSIQREADRLIRQQEREDREDMF